MEHAADTAEAAAVDHYFPSPTENHFRSSCLPMDIDGKQTGDCFVMRPSSVSSTGLNTSESVTDCCCVTGSHKFLAGRGQRAAV